jgi:hypothetical protein
MNRKGIKDLLPTPDQSVISQASFTAVFIKEARTRLEKKTTT